MFQLIRLISLRHLSRSPLRSSLTVLGVAVGVATMVAVASINRSVMDAFRSTVDTIAGRADLVVSGTQSGFDEAVLEQVRAVDGVAHAASALSVVAPVAGRPGESLMVMGVDLLDDGYFRTYRGQDRDVSALADDLGFLNSSDRLLLSVRFAREHGLAEGDTLRLVTSEGVRPFVIHGLLEESGPIKAFGGSVAVMFLPSAQEAFQRGTRIDRIDVAASPAVGVDEVKARIERRLGPAFEVERPGRRGDSVAKMVRTFQMGLNLGSGIALMVGVFLVYNTISIGVAQRRREIGALRALGATRRWIRALFTLEATAMGLVGAALGLPLGIAAARAGIGWVSGVMGNIYVQVNARDVTIGPWELALGAAMGILGSAAAALRPAVHASRIQPVEALRRDLLVGGAQGGARWAWPAMGALQLALAWPATWIPSPAENFPLGGYVSIGLILAGMTLLTSPILKAARRPLRAPGGLLLGISGELAAENFSRAPGRTAVPVSALAAGVAMTVCIGGFVASFQRASVRWIDQTVPADLFVTSSAALGGVRNTPMQPELMRDLERIAGVSQVDPVRIFPHDVLGLRVYVVASDSGIYWQHGHPEFVEGRAPTDPMRRQGYVIVSENFSRRRDLHVGDPFEMTTPTGLRRYRVAGVMIDYTSDQGAIFLDRRIFDEQFQDRRVDTFEIYLADRSRLPEVRREITERFARERNLYVLTNAELRDEATRLIDGAFSVTYAMEGVAVVLALLGVINTLLAAVLDRTREIGLLRAIGASRGQVIRVFAAEAAFMGIFGALVGIASGVLTGLVVTFVVGSESTGWSFPYLFPWRLALQMTVAAAGCAVIAGLYPARRAAGLDVVEALAYE